MNWPVYHVHVAKGRYYGYPECCIEQYALDTAKGVHEQAKRRGIVFKGRRENGEEVQYVPCDNCEADYSFEEWCTLLAKGAL